MGRNASGLKSARESARDRLQVAGRDSDGEMQMDATTARRIVNPALELASRQELLDSQARRLVAQVR